MECFVWQKFYPGQFVQMVLGHPNHIIGMWIKVWCKLTSIKTTWTCTETLDGWARVIGESQRDTKQFINYIKDNFNGIKITTSSAGTSKPKITITDEWYNNMKKQRLKGAERTRKSRNSKKPEITSSRLNLFSKILDTYHPNKLLKAPIQARKEFTEIVKESSKSVKGTQNRIEAEVTESTKIIEYINYLKTTRIWKKEEGRFLPGIGDFMASRVWQHHKAAPSQHENRSYAYESTRESSKDKISNLLEQL